MTTSQRENQAYHRPRCMPARKYGQTVERPGKESDLERCDDFAEALMSE